MDLLNKKRSDLPIVEKTTTIEDLERRIEFFETITFGNGESNILARLSKVERILKELAPTKDDDLHLIINKKHNVTPKHEEDEGDCDDEEYNKSN